MLKSFTYNGLGRLSQSAVSSGNSAVLTTTYTYRDWGTANTTTQVATLSNSYGSANTPTSESFSYTYDANGNIASVTYGSNTTIYEYDALNELVWEKNAAASKAWEYSYDLGGNILSKKEYDYQNGVVGSTPLSTITYTYGDASWPDLLTAYNGSPITYDGIGNPTSYRGWSFTWQGGRQLAAASDGATSLSFQYNESGLRTEKTVGSDVHRYVYRGSLLAAEVADNYALYFHHDGNGEIVGFTYSTNNTDTEYFYRKNLQGDVIGIVDAAGSSAAKYTYDAWGNILSATDTMANVNPIRYRGYYYDTETGLYYLQSRYYDPEVGRFINADAFASTGQGILGANMFAYCGNEPVNGVDYTGQIIADATRPWGSGDGVAGYLTVGGATLPNLRQSDASELFGTFLAILTASLTKIADLNEGYEIHHIVAQRAWRAIPARLVLKQVYKNDGGVNNPNNLVLVEYDVHRRIHNKYYYDFVNAVVVDAYVFGSIGGEKGQKIVVTEALRILGILLQSI